MRRPLIAANWKMNKTTAEARAFCEALLPRLDGAAGGAEAAICPPYLALPLVAGLCEGSGVGACAQNMHYEESGAYTGEVSAAMLLDAGASGVVLGHSERRQYFGETDEALSRKLPVALAAGLVPILCVGESEGERERGETDQVLRRQLDAALARVDGAALADVVIAYEPIWAIGTGRTATAEQANDACGFIRALVAARDGGAAERIRIQYGGSVKPGNAAELLGQSDIDGALVGGASLDPDDFAAIVAAA
ncbi:MAG: triose-phosphate isomerase [Acidobacteria bacterium]|nr:MAG: triose-phosphate isomerase [Acidobacteriota bacterium]MCL4288140.1 triose-phosphate isomerase [Thermoleophilia bacterium]GIK77532.1 MAG: triosephosphate isomerase [Actinomycetes bacterium]